MKLTIGIVLNAVVLFVFGFLFWAANPLPAKTWNLAPDPGAAESALIEQFPETGVYGVPGPGGTPTAVQAMLYVNHQPPEDPMDPVTMVYDFIQYLVVGAVLVFVLQRGSTLGGQVARAALLGLAAVVVIEGSDLIWWLYPLAWKLWVAVYHVLVFVISALVLSKFLPEAESGS